MRLRIKSGIDDDSKDLKNLGICGHVVHGRLVLTSRWVLRPQAGNNLLIVQSPGQPAVVQQVQLVSSKQEPPAVQIPQQALKVVQAASASLPPVPQRQSPAPCSLQVPSPDAVPTQVGQPDPLVLF